MIEDRLALCEREAMFFENQAVGIRPPPARSNLNDSAHIPEISRDVKRRWEITMRKATEYGNRRHERIDLMRRAAVALTPSGPWLDCMLLDISEEGARLDVGGLPVPKLFMLILTPNGAVRRACLRIWRRGPLLGAHFVGLKQLQRGVGPQKYIDPRLQKVPIKDPFV